MRALLAAVLAVLVTALACSPASADSGQPTLDGLEHMAQTWWQDTSGLTVNQPYVLGGYRAPGCGQSVTISADPLGPGDLGQVMMPGGCHISIDKQLVDAIFNGAPVPKPVMAGAIDAKLTKGTITPRVLRALLCEVVFHETGHVLGQVHQPGTIMNSNPVRPPGVCMTWADTTGGVHVTAAAPALSRVRRRPRGPWHPHGRAWLRHLTPER